MKKITIILLALFFKAFAFSQETKIEFNNLNIKTNDLIDHKVVFVDENNSVLITKKKIVKISNEVSVLDVNPVIYNKTIFGTEVENALDTTNLKYYTLNIVSPNSFNTNVYINYWDFNNSKLSTLIEFKINKPHSNNFILFVNEEKLNLLVWTHLKYEIFEVDFIAKKFKSQLKVESTSTNFQFEKNEKGEIYKIETNTSDLKQDIKILKLNKNDFSFAEFGDLVININEGIKIGNDEYSSQRRVKINPFDNNQIVIYYSQLTEKANDKSALDNRYREHFIYECDIKNETINEKKIIDKSMYTFENKGLEIIFQKTKIVYLEFLPVIYKDDEGNQIRSRLEYVFDEENELSDLKLRMYLDDIKPSLEKKIDKEDLEIINERKINDKGYAQHYKDYSAYKSKDELVCYRFLIEGQKKGYGGYFKVFKVKL